MVPRIGVEPFDVGYGAAYLAADLEVAALECPIVEDGGEFTVHTPTAVAAPERLAFVDGVMRTDARLTRTEDDGAITIGLAGSWAAGAALTTESGRMEVTHTEVGRMGVFGSGAPTALPEVDGWEWAAVAIEDDAAEHPDAARQRLQRAMRDAEGALADRLAGEGRVVVLDGPLNNVRPSRSVPLVGYVKTHHRPMLAPALWARVPELGTGQRCSLFAIGQDRYGCYLRVGDAGPWSSSWAGIVRLEVPSGVGRGAAAETMNAVASWLPAFASAPHRDPRAPVNLAPIAGLEQQLRRLMGAAPLALRAVRAAAMRLEQTTGATT